MRIAVLGAGAMGSWFGGKLALQGYSVQLLTTNQAHRDAINNNTLVLRQNGADQSVNINIDEPTNIQTPVDLVLLFTKAFQTRDAMAGIAHAIDEKTHVLSLQNGLGNAENISTHLPLERCWIGVSMIPVDKIAPGIVACKGDGNSFYGNAINVNDQAITHDINAAFKLAGIDLEHVSNVHQRIWEKVAFNAGMNALTALSHGRPGSIAELPSAKELAQRIATEVVMVAKSQSIDININTVFDMIELSCTKHGDHIPSMLQDLLSRKRTEVDALNGAVVDVAKSAGMEAPLNDMLATLLRLAEISHQRYQ